jgi:hypothetical protein
MEIESTAWFPLEEYAPVRAGWYEVQLSSGETAFSKFADGEWTEKPALVFTHWRGLSAIGGDCRLIRRSPARTKTSMPKRRRPKAFAPPGMRFSPRWPMSLNRATLNIKAPEHGR